MIFVKIILAVLSELYRMIMFQQGSVFLSFASFLWAAANADQASYAANTADAPGNQDPVTFQEIYVNRGSALDPGTFRLTVQSRGLFLITLSAGHPGSGGTTDYRLQRDGTTLAMMYRGSDDLAVDNTNGLDLVSSFDGGNILHVRSDGTTLTSSADGLLTSWGSVSLQQTMGVSVGFGACRTTPNDSSKIFFDRVWTNVGNAYDEATSEFVAPEPGIYFFSISMGMPTANFAGVHLYINGESYLYAYRGQRMPYINESFSRSIVIYLNIFDRVDVSANNNGHSDGNCLTTFSGFLYSTGRANELAWSAYRTGSHYGTTDALTWDLVTLNTGGVLSNGRVTCPHTGLYFVHMSAGLTGDNPATMTLMKGAQSQGQVRRIGMDTNLDVIGRSMIIQCNAGETLRVTVSPAEAHLRSHMAGKQTSFAGFYLFA